jgi:hypothetical protein
VVFASTIFDIFASLKKVWRGSDGPQLAGENILTWEPPEIITDRFRLRRGQADGRIRGQIGVCFENDPSTEAFVVAIEDYVLAGRRSPLRPVEVDLNLATGEPSYTAERRDVPMPNPGLEFEPLNQAGRLARQPTKLPGIDVLTKEPRMVAALYDDQRISGKVLGGDEPG